MGTNYYIKQKACEHCGHSQEPVHLGKSSFGWKFTLQSNDFKYYRDWLTMKAWLADKEIQDEYGRPMTVQEFIDWVEAKQATENTTDPSMLGPYWDLTADTRHDIDGYDFHDGEFS